MDTSQRVTCGTLDGDVGCVGSHGPWDGVVACEGSLTCIRVFYSYHLYVYLGALSTSVCVDFVVMLSSVHV